MRILCTMAGALLALGSSAAHGQAPAATTFASAGEVRALAARAAAEIKPGQPVLVLPLLHYAPTGTTLEYRQGVTIAAIHKAEAEMFVVLAGGGTLVQGGTLADAKPIDARNDSGTRVTGGSARHIAAGDVLVVPAGTPHWFSAIDGTLVMVVTKVPLPAAHP